MIVLTLYFLFNALNTLNEVSIFLESFNKKSFVLKVHNKKCKKIRQKYLEYKKYLDNSLLKIVKRYKAFKVYFICPIAIYLRGFTVF